VKRKDILTASFLGTGWSFPPSFSKEMEGVVTVTGEEDIQQSLHVLLSTLPGERPMNTEYGCPVNEYLFDTMDSSTLNKLKDVIDKAILYYEPRITLNDVTIDSSQYMDGMLFISLDYTIRTTNSRNNMVFPFYLNEGTLLNL
jgi:phage baseplate assembly protein W